MPDSSFDYIIVGAGSAGCVLANRLSEDVAARVLLIEAGGRDWHPYIHIPLGLGGCMTATCSTGATKPIPSRTSITGVSRRCAARSWAVHLPSTSWLYPGNPGDYDRWAQKGARGWSYADVLPYFRRCETFARGEDTWRGGAGPLGTEFARTEDPLYEAWLEAAKSCGYPLTSDYNGEQQEGFRSRPIHIRDGYARLPPTRFSNRRGAKKSHRRDQTLIRRASHSTALGDGYRIRPGWFDAARERDARGDPCRRHIQHTAILMLSGSDRRSICATSVSASLPTCRRQESARPSRRLHDLHPQAAGQLSSRNAHDRMAVSMIRAYLFGQGPGTSCRAAACLHQDAARTCGARY